MIIFGDQILLLVLLLLQQLLFTGILQLSGLKLLQQLILFCPLRCTALLILFTAQQRCGRLTPAPPSL